MEKRVVDLRCGRLVTGDQQCDHATGDFVDCQDLIIAVTHTDQIAGQIVGRALHLAPNQVDDIMPERDQALRHLGLFIGGGPAVIEFYAVARPSLHLRHIGIGHAQNVEQDISGIFKGELGNDIDRLALADLVNSPFGNCPNGRARSSSCGAV